MTLATRFCHDKFLLTGATGGIGSALAKKLLEQGAEVIAHGRDELKLKQLVNNLGSNHTRYVSGDLANTGELKSVAEFAIREDVTGLINCAGTNQFSTFENADIERVIATNVTGPLLLSQALLAHLKKLKDAWLVNIGSTFGAIGYPGYVSYCASKHAIRGFSEALMRELTDTGVKVLYISPRATQTDMNSDAAMQLNRDTGVSFDTAEEVASSIIKAMNGNVSRSQLGWPEKLQTRINALLPAIVDGAINKQLPIIQKYLSNP